jgi:hypothetical protein
LGFNVRRSRFAIVPRARPRVEASEEAAGDDVTRNWSDLDAGGMSGGMDPER